MNINYRVEVCLLPIGQRVRVAVVLSKVPHAEPCTMPPAGNDLLNE